MRVHARYASSCTREHQFTRESNSRVYWDLCTFRKKYILCGRAHLHAPRIFRSIHCRVIHCAIGEKTRKVCAQIGRVTRQIGGGRDGRNDRKKLCFLLPIIPQWKSASVEETVQSKKVFALRWLKIRSDYGNAVRPKSSTHANWTFLLKSYSSLIVILQHLSLGMAHLDSRCHTRPSVLSRSLVQP